MSLYVVVPLPSIPLWDTIKYKYRREVGESSVPLKSSSCVSFLLLSQYFYLLHTKATNIGINHLAQGTINDSAVKLKAISGSVSGLSL